MAEEKIIITINGKKLKGLNDLIEVLVDTNVHLPNMFSILISDEPNPTTGRLTYTDSDDTFKLGAEVKIEIETNDIPGEHMPVKSTLIIGEITALEPAFTDTGLELLQIRGYDRSHRLNRGKKTRTFGDANPKGAGTTEEKIINTIVQETEGITGKKVDASGLVNLKYPYVLQMNQTDLEFLWARAELIGYQVYVEDKTLYFQKADAHRGSIAEKPAPLRWPDNLLSFHPRLTLAKQVNQAVVTGWDPSAKKQVESKSSSDKSKTTPSIGPNKTGSQVAKSALKGSAEDTLVAQPGLTIDQAKAMAAARFAAAESEFIQADGVVRDGDPRLIAGRVVKIEGVGRRFSGNYYITEARHIYSKGLYRVTFSVSGRAPYTASRLLSSANGSSANQIQGVVTAKVISLEDPEQLGRVQVMYPWLPKYKGADLASNWARLASPMAGKDRGLYYLPEVDDEVLVAFEHGDPNFPYIVGMLWNQKDKPPTGTAQIVAKDKKKVNQRVLCSRSGHKIILDDTDGKEQIIIQDKTEKNKIVIDSKKNSMTINVEKDLTIVANGNASIESTGELSLKSKKDVSIECAKLTIKASGAAKVEGAQMEIKGTAMVNVSNGSGAKVALSGPTVNLN
ncbi:MAG: hypothetical protein FOGNACKC_04723 [Anaerolineae bacterium]|nr:hypothetical protein [Anaerolineae bacterium]